MGPLKVQAMDQKLYVGNLPFKTFEIDLRKLSAQAGAVDSARVARNRATSRTRGFAFVEMSTDAAVQHGS